MSDVVGMVATVSNVREKGACDREQDLSGFEDVRSVVGCNDI